METIEAAKPEVKISNLLNKGLVVLTKVMAKDEITLSKNDMIDFINFETAVKFIIDCEHKAEQSKIAPDIAPDARSYAEAAS